MCKWDEAYTEREMLEETEHCKNCKLNCNNAGKELSEKEKTKIVCRNFIELVKDLTGKG